MNKSHGIYPHGFPNPLIDKYVKYFPNDNINHRLLCARSCVKHFACVISSNPSNNPVERWYYIPFFTNTETKIRNLFSVTSF